jgi:hypothetical protein
MGRFDGLTGAGDAFIDWPEVVGSIRGRTLVLEKLRRIVDESVGYGLALEGSSAADVAPSR